MSSSEHSATPPCLDVRRAGEALDSGGQLVGPARAPAAGVAGQSRGGAGFSREALGAGGAGLGRRSVAAWGGNIQGLMREMVKFFRTNPQALVLLIICVVLGLGTFIAVLISLAQHSNGT